MLIFPTTTLWLLMVPGAVRTNLRRHNKISKFQGGGSGSSVKMVCGSIVRFRGKTKLVCLVCRKDGKLTDFNVPSLSSTDYTMLTRRTAIIFTVITSLHDSRPAVVTSIWLIRLRVIAFGSTQL